MKIVYTGIESSGKSLMLAKKAQEIVKRNSRWYKKTGIERPIVSNMRFSQSFESYAMSKNVPIIYWDNLEDIIYRTECDVFIDEIIKYFDARNWQSLTIDAKHWLTQGAKTGIHVYGSCQDFSQVEKSFRLLCTEVYVITKLIGSRRPMKSAPPVKRIWGVCVSRQVNPVSFKGDNVSMETVGFPSIFFIQREDCVIFNTSAKVVPSNLPIKKHYPQKHQYIKDGVVVREEIKFV